MIRFKRLQVPQWAGTQPQSGSFLAQERAWHVVLAWWGRPLWQQHRSTAATPQHRSCVAPALPAGNTSPEEKEAPRASGLSNFSEALSTNPETLGYLLLAPQAGPFEKRKLWGEKTPNLSCLTFFAVEDKCHVVIYACFLLLLSPYWVLVLLSPHWLCLNPYTECDFLLHFKTHHYANVSNAYTFVHTEQCYHRITAWVRLEGTNYFLSATESNLMHIHWVFLPSKWCC